MKVHHSARTGEYTANQYVSQDGKQSALYAFLRSQECLHPVPTVRLRGPDESAIYRVKTTDNKWPHASETYSGSYLMNHGITLHLTGDYDSTVVEFDRER